MKGIAVVGGWKKFKSFLEMIGANIDYAESVSDVLMDREYEALIVLPEYDNKCEIVNQFTLEDMELLAERKREGFRVYAENYNAYNTYHVSVFGCEVIGKVCHVNSESFCSQDGLQYHMDGDRILQAAGTAYLPAIMKIRDPYALENKLLLTKGEYIGTSRIAQSKVDNVLPMLIQSGSVYTALFSMTNLDTVNFRPNCRWKKVFGYIFSNILNVDSKAVERAFEKCYQPLGTRMSPHSEIKDDELKEMCRIALEDAVQWHFDSGIILGEKGEKGSMEMIMSNNGQDLYRNRRVDAGMYTGWLLHAAGSFLSREDWKETGSNVFNYFSEHGQLSGGRPDGLFTWYYNKDAGPHWIYSIDSGRCGIALCNMYRMTGNEKILERIHRLAEGFCGWMNGELLYSNLTEYEDPLSDKPYSVGGGTRTPAVYAEMGVFMIMASRLTGQEKYRDIVCRIADRLVKEYPDYDYYGHTTSSRMARLLMLLLSVQLTGERDYADLINVCIDYLASIQLPCGGIYAEDNLTLEGKIEVNNEGGITTPWDSDYISDQLYCVNNTLAALSMLKGISDESKIQKDKGLKMFNRLLKYIVKIQIVSDDKRFHGGWMRSYSITHQEYYGLTADKFWGPYCIMAGWTMGILPFALLTELTGECPYFIDNEEGVC